MEFCQDFKLDQSTRIFYDDCSQNNKEHLSDNIGNYFLVPKIRSNHKDVTNKMLQNKVMYTTLGKGWSGENGNLIDIDSNLRNAHNLTNTKELHRDHDIDYFPNPYLARGPGNPCIEAVLRVGENVYQSKPCNSLAGYNENERFIPLVPSLRDIQNPKHVVQEVVNDKWIRGGTPSRQLNKSPAVLNKLGFRYNGKYWERNKK